MLTAVPNGGDSCQHASTIVNKFWYGPQSSRMMLTCSCTCTCTCTCRRPPTHIWARPGPDRAHRLVGHGKKSRSWTSGHNASLPPATRWLCLVAPPCPAPHPLQRARRNPQYVHRAAVLRAATPPPTLYPFSARNRVAPPRRARMYMYIYIYIYMYIYIYI